MCFQHELFQIIMSSKVTKTLSFVRLADIIQMAREKKLEKLGFAPLPQQTEWVFGESFPTESFFLRGAAAKVVYQWSPELMEFYNYGDCVVEYLIEKYNCGGIMANDGNDFDLPGSRTLSFEFPAGSSNVIFPKPPNLAITSVASIAKLGEWCTVGHIEWRGAVSIAKVIGGTQMWIICNNIEAGVDLFKQDTFSKLRDFVLNGVSSNPPGSSGLKRKPKVHYFYHIAEPEDVIVQPSCAVHAVLTEPRYNRKGELLCSLVTGYEALGTVFVPELGRRVVNKLSTGIEKGLVIKEIQLHG